MDQWQAIVDGWGSSLCPKIELAALMARNPLSHKWKATYRSIVIRELSIWRVQDLTAQALFLAKNNRWLGALILLRSAFEALAVLVYLNEKTDAVLRGEESFFAFDELTTRLMIGSKNQSTPEESINILTILKHCDKKYPGIFAMYADLSECAHPNYEGMSRGYSKIDDANFTTVFSNRWDEIERGRLLNGIELCLKTFEHEYNVVWTVTFTKLEAWLTENDARLEAERGGA